MRTKINESREKEKKKLTKEKRRGEEKIRKEH